MKTAIQLTSIQMTSVIMILDLRDD